MRERESKIALVDDDCNPCIVSEEYEPINSYLLVSLWTKVSGVQWKTSDSELTATQNFSTRPGAVDTVASADRNQQSPEAPWMISFEFAAPSAKNLGSSKICVTRCTSAGRLVSDGCVNKPNRHRFLSFSTSNSISLRSFISNRLSMSSEGEGSGRREGGRARETHLNFLFFERQSFAIRSTLALHSAIAFSSSFVTKSPGSCLTNDTVLGTFVFVVSTVVTVVVAVVAAM